MSSSNQPFRPRGADGTVVAILSKREIVLSIGSADGVELGSRYVILGETVVEPTPGTTLQVPFAKAVVKVVRFFEDGHYSVGRTYRIIKGAPAKPGLFADFVMAPGLRALQQGTPAVPDQVEQLSVEQSETVLAGLEAEDKIVRPGDRVELTLGDEYDEVD